MPAELSGVVAELGVMPRQPSPDSTHRISRGRAGCPGRPVVARIATVSRTPRAAVATSGIVYGSWKPDADACGADATPISSAAQAAQRCPARYPRAAITLSTAAPIPAATSPTAGATCRNVSRTRLQRVRSRAAAAISTAAISGRPVGRPAAAGTVPGAAAGGTRGCARRPISMRSRRSRAPACAVPAARSACAIWPCRAGCRVPSRPSPGCHR